MIGGLIKLEEKEGIKLYSSALPIAPFIIPALQKTMTETEVPAHLFAEITAELGLSLAAAAAGVIMTLKTKVMIATGTVAVTGGIIAGVIISDFDDPQEVYNPETVTNNRS